MKLSALAGKNQFLVDYNRCLIHSCKNEVEACNINLIDRRLSAIVITIEEGVNLLRFTVPLTYTVELCPYCMNPKSYPNQ